ncbi:S-layer homology domain-containing protein [Lysinibacillus xylanilyticus]|uniref:S-layer homology domain-containing protein n=1 Tax=Lysinibacillus xylanilyticus TaxID=582475 RepID=UPI002B24AB2B|nr:S-layer homology domain-containing protein [Lysinibacillus xylanilyticus]MEB2300405.1 S-layer homology domain-containing protein [Lysinibacillus xylanilyticus]
MKKTVLAGALSIACFTGGFGLQANAQEIVRDNVEVASIIHPKQVVAATIQVQSMTYQDLYKRLLISDLAINEHGIVTTKNSITAKFSIDPEWSAQKQKEFKEMYGSTMQIKFTPSGNSYKGEVLTAGGKWVTLDSKELNTVITTMLPEKSFDLKPGGYFTDSIGHWAESYIQVLYQFDIINGTSATTFNPNGKVTRGQLASMIFRAAGLDVKEDYEGPASYKDLANFSGAKEVAILEEYGLIDIFDGANFEPNKPATREEMAFVTASYLEGMDYDVSKVSKNNPFTDKNKMRQETVEAIGLLKQLGVIDGVNGQFNPKGNLTRAEFSKILTLTLVLLDDEE